MGHQHIGMYCMISYQEAVHYLNSVKFSYGPRAHDELVEILKKLDPESILKVDLTAMLFYIYRDIFRNDAQMIEGFGKFLPEGYRLFIQADRMYVLTPVLQYWISLFNGQAFILDSKRSQEIHDSMAIEDLIQQQSKLRL